MTGSSESCFVDDRGVPQKLRVQRVMSYLIGTATAPGGVDLIQVEAQQNLIPPCAMHVTRSVEMGPLASYAPPGARGCYLRRSLGTASLRDGSRERGTLACIGTLPGIECGLRVMAGDLGLIADVGPRGPQAWNGFSAT